MIRKNGLTLFFTSADSFSNWHIRPFVLKGITFNCGEQAMMYSKAMLFGDAVTAQKIMLLQDPREQKAEGKRVKNFKEEKWHEHREKIIAAILYHKFTQHEDFKKLLLSTQGTEIVEASPYDRIWGIGMGQNDPNLMDRSRWGQNLLGKCLMKVREHILKLEKEKHYQANALSL
ncbi:NADAR family protein [Pseudomonas luteola]